MILLLSGEGPTDLGFCVLPTNECEGADFIPGPMAWVVDKLVEQVWSYSPLGTSSCLFVPEHALAMYCRSLRHETTLPGLKRRFGTGYFFKNARGLAQLAKSRSRKDSCPVGAILFRDSDGTNADVRTRWSEKVGSIERGFLAEEFECGVAMVPKPKSEAWLLCALQAVPYQNCGQFEDRSGNDASPNSLKAELSAVLGTLGKTYSDVAGMIEHGAIDPNRIAMPSFNHFQQRLEKVARLMQMK